MALLREAAKQIDMAAYVLTDHSVIDASREASARGVKVRIWRDASEAARFSEFDVEGSLADWSGASRFGQRAGCGGNASERHFASTIAS